MTHIVRLSMVNWYLYSVQDIEMRGATAILGPNGVGKSSLLDAIQLVVTANNRRYLKLNASSNVTSGSVRRNRDEPSRSVHGYCLGTVDGQRMRENSITYVCVTFEGEQGQRLSAGISLLARAGDQEEETVGAFILPGGDLCAEDFLEPDLGSGRTPLPYDAFISRLRSRSQPVEDYRSRLGGTFTKTLLGHLAGKRSVDAERFLRATRNGLQLREISSANDFVRDYILEADPLDIQSLRESVSRYRGFQEKIGDLELQERELREISDQHRQLGEATTRAATYEWMLARFRRDRVAERRSDLRTVLAALTAKREALEREASTVRGALDEVCRSIIRAEEARRHDDVGRAVSALIADAAEQERLATAAERTRDELLSAGQSLAHTVMTLRGRFSGLDLDAVAARGARLVKSLGNPEDGERIDGVLQDLLPYVDAALGSIEERRISVAGREHVLRAEMTDMQGRLKRMRESGGAIGAGTARFLDMLSDAGIDATPVCDLLEVPDDAWREIVEAVMGPAREAVVVPHADIPAALSMIRRNRRVLAGCRVVVPAERDIERASDSLASRVETASPEARAFVDAHLGSIAIADAVEALESGHQAVLSDGTLSIGGAARTIEGVAVPMLGREARRLALVRLEDEIADRQSRADAHRSEMEKLGDAERQLRQGRIMPTEERLQDVQSSLRRASASAKSLRERASALEGTRPAELSHVLQKFEEDQKSLSSTLASVDRDLYETRLRQDRAGTDAESVNGDLAQALNDLEKLDEQLQARSPDLDALEREYGGLLDRHGSDAFETSIMGLHRTAANQSARLGGAAPQMTKEFAWRHRSEGFDPEAGPDEQAAWVNAQLETVAGHGLRRYKEQADEARVTMEGALREHLLVKLYARIVEAKRQIADLNRQLSMRRFHRQLYEIKVDTDAGYREIVEVARRVHEQTDDVTDLFANPSTYGADVARGVARVRSMIESDGDAGLVGDYRNYLQFDLVTRNEEGRIVSTHSSRASTGSGGERQVPFYIAIAAALASACYGTPVPGRRQHGLGLALFDEAFNALDDANIAACLQFMDELGLQVIAAAPEGKRPQFMENMDTIISIYRHGLHCEIDVEHTTQAGRSGFRAANPLYADA
ncbi:SbcC/MukB-like Walker B domain-containing protein [Sphingomonas sp. 3-13AW]|uniref:SbcC/MukB-like Walker B domain-containing protein n=1 Tax=Sphingomonas sp. 3-13AW TaxID=3050450 RepID=UPI003BB4B848